MRQELEVDGTCVSEERRRDDRELRRLRSEVAAHPRDIHHRDDLEHRQEALIARLRDEVAVREQDLVLLHERLETAQHELEDLRAVRDALTPPELPRRPGLELAAAFLPAVAERVSGDFYLVADGPQDSTVLVVGDVVGPVCRQRGAHRSFGRRSPRPRRSRMIPAACSAGGTPR
jgi:serine phosphatase RsbU (regulator of sigma subunit)